MRSPAYFQNYFQVMRQRPSEDVQQQLHALILVGRELEESRRRALLENLFGGSYEYFIKVVAPMTVAHWNEYQPFEQQFLLDVALGQRQRRIADAESP